MIEQTNSENLLNRPLELPCGAIIKNRLVKSAMSDSLGDGKGNATTRQARLYERWAEGGIGLSIVGEVQVDPKFPESPGNLVLTDSSDLKALQRLTSRASINNAHIWPQLGHAGGLAYSQLSHAAGPSPLKIGEFECAGMSEKDIALLPDRYSNAAKKANEAAFTGVQIHARHVSLLSQLLSPLFNRRQNQYGGAIEARSQIIVTIINKIRHAVGHTFPIGIKMNSSDRLEGGLTQEDALTLVSILDRTSLDLIEISGGSYFPGAKSSSDSSSNGPYFVDFATAARKVTNIPLVVTGGFKQQEQAIEVISSQSVDAIGLGRSLILMADLPRRWINNSGDNPEFPRFQSPPQGGVTAWYTMLLTALADDKERDFNLTLLEAIQRYKSRDKRRIQKWLAKYQ